MKNILVFVFAIGCIIVGVIGPRHLNAWPDLHPAPEAVSSIVTEIYKDTEKGIYKVRVDNQLHTVMVFTSGDKVNAAIKLNTE
jgi:hypothetical protein